MPWSKKDKKHEKPFRDFTLFEVTHLTGQDMDLLAPEMIGSIVDERVAIAKRFIEEEVSAGRLRKKDLVLVETPKRVSFRGLLKARDVHGSGTEAALRILWNLYLQKHSNMYYRIADFARKKGLRVYPADPSLAGATGTLSKLNIRVPATSWPVGLRIKYLAEIKREKVMLARIQARKPKLVIVASGHAARIERIVKPQRAVWTTPTHWLAKEMEFRRKELLQKEYLAEKAARRREINKEKGLRTRKGWRPKA